nr:hypothetical protein [Tanacetum cinerariifolium]
MVPKGVVCSVLRKRALPLYYLGFTTRHNRGVLSWYDLSATCHSKDSGPSQGLYLCRIFLRAIVFVFCRCLSCSGFFTFLVGSSGLNKVITIEVLCWSLQIELTVTLFRVFQTLCKQGDWFSFAKRRAPSPACCWFFNMADVRRLSAHVIKLRDMPKGVLVLSGLSRIWKNHFRDPVLRGADGNGIGEEPHLDVRPTLQRLPFYYTPPAAADAVILNPTLEDLAADTPSSKILSKAEASQKRKASTSGAASSHVAKRTRSALAQSSSSTTRPSLFAGDDDKSDDDDACVEIPLVTPLCSVAVIPSSGNQGGSSVAPTAEG